MANCSKKRSAGFYLPMVLTFAVVFFIIGSAVISLALSNFSLVKKQTRSNSALNIAEAGINYYLWHLAHNNQDYCDGNPCSGGGPYGPYTHEYRDTQGNVVGSFSITISPPTSLAGAVTVRSEGVNTSGEKRVVLATLGMPSFAQYSFVTSSEVWFGSSETTVGLVHSNSGIHFDGTAQGLVNSAVQTYRPSSCFGGDGTVKQGIWGNGGPQTFWHFPVPQVDFNRITSDLNDLRSAAINGGIRIPTLSGTNPNQRSRGGYIIQLKTTGFRLGQVTASRDSGGSSGSCARHDRYYSLLNNVTWESTDRAYPSNGILFIEDNVWVYGTTNTRLTIASGRLPSNNNTDTNIFLQDDILYTAKDGSVALGLISQSDIVVNSNSENDLEINAYLLSQKGKVFRPYYANNIRQRIYIYGGIGASSWWTWSWVNSSGNTISGYRNTVQQYDEYLALNPPPLFPTTGSYAVLSWKEEPIL